MDKMQYIKREVKDRDYELNKRSYLPILPLISAYHERRGLPLLIDGLHL